MKDLFVCFLIACIAVFCCIISYRCGFTTGQANCPIKYAVCDNGTCILSDVPPAVYYQIK